MTPLTLNPWKLNKHFTVWKETFIFEAKDLCNWSEFDKNFHLSIKHSLSKFNIARTKEQYYPMVNSSLLIVFFPILSSNTSYFFTKKLIFQSNYFFGTIHCCVIVHRNALLHFPIEESTSWSSFSWRKGPIYWSFGYCSNIWKWHTRWCSFELS